MRVYMCVCGCVLQGSGWPGPPLEVFEAVQTRGNPGEVLGFVWIFFGVEVFGPGLEEGEAFDEVFEGSVCVFSQFFHYLN